MSIESDPSVWKHVSSWLWVILAPIIGVAWGMLNRRIDRTEEKAEAALPKVDFEKFVDKQREDIKELFHAQSQLKDHVNARVETLRTDMHEGIGRLRDLMQKGFDEVRREVLEVLKAVNARRRE